jgi:3-oxoacyl-(acyl-carrier-protein) synthase
MRRRVKITGIGPVTPAGIGREAFYRGINEPVSRVGLITRNDPGEGQFIGAEIRDFDLRRYAPEENPRRMSRHTQFGLVAAILALQDAGLTAELAECLNPIVVTGTSLMDFTRISREIKIVETKGPRYAMASNLYETSIVNVPGKIVELIGPSARMLSLQTSCCSGVDAIGQAAEMVATGQANLAVAGGTEAPLTYHPLVEFDAAELNPSTREHPEKSCRPFDLWRSTGVLGEGAAMLVLEPEDSPRRAYAWVTGYGYFSDPDGIAGSGLFEAINIALANARHRSVDIDYINAWGPGHRLIDANEAFALRRILGTRLDEIPAASIKGAIGTALAAAGPIQIASVALSIANGVLPPTVNWTTPDPNCPLNLSAQVRHIRPKVALINSHGMAGTNAVVILER